MGESPLAMPESTPEPGSSPSAPGDVDYWMLPDLDTEAAGGQSPVRRGAGTEPPSPMGKGTHVQTIGEGSPVQADAGTLGLVFLPRPLAALSVCRYGLPGAARGSVSWTLPRVKYLFARFTTFHLSSLPSPGLTSSSLGSA